MLQIPLLYVWEILVIVSPATTVYWIVGPTEQVTAGAEEVVVAVPAGMAATRVEPRVRRAMIEVRMLMVGRVKLGGEFLLGGVKVNDLVNECVCVCVCVCSE